MIPRSAPYQVKPFTGGSFWLYNNGFIDVSVGNNVDLNITAPNKLRRVVKTVDSAIYFYDIGVYVNARVSESEMNLYLTPKSVEDSFKLGLGFYAKVIEWTNLARSYSYPNVLIGLLYAVGSEMSNQFVLHPGGA